MVYTVVQWATGNVGVQSLRALSADPRFAVIGGYVYNPAKVGKDLGELAGGEPLGVLATNNAEDIVALNADCVVYNALGDSGDATQCVNDICALLESGKNVVSTAISTHVHPEAINPDDRARLEKACATGQVTLYGTGINPGFAFDAFPIALSSVARRIDRIHVLELVDMSGYTSKSIVSDLIGMGLDPGTTAPMEYLSDLRWSPYFPCVQLITDALGVTYDDFVIQHSKAVTEDPIDLPWGRIDAGTVAVRRIVIDALTDGSTVLEYELIWRVSDKAAPEWPSGKAHYVVTIAGDPTLSCRLDIDSDTGRGTSIATAMAAVNAIPAVCAAPSGIATRLGLKVFGGGYFPAAATSASTQEVP
jgi:2,4-diaminopentanoate dehydrogenase